MTKLVFKTTPYPHQVKALRFGLRRILDDGARGFGVYVPMRWGKTKVAIDAASALSKLGLIDRVLVVTVASGLGVWEDEIPTHQPDDVELDWQIINWEGTYDRVSVPTEDAPRSWEPVESEELFEFCEGGKCLLVVDEVHHAGKPTAVQSKHAFHLSQLCELVIFMTGSPFHRKPFFVFGQFKVYDVAVFGTSWTAFKKKVAIFSPYNPHIVVSYRNLRWLQRKVRKHVFIEEYVPPRPPVLQTIHVELDESRELYERMDRESIVKTSNGYVTAPIVLTKHLRLQQIAGGWVRTEEGHLECVGREKLRMFSSLLEELYESVPKIVVGMRFLPELIDAARACKKAGYRVILLHGGVAKSERKPRWKDFNGTKDKVAFVSIIQAGREAINLSGADTCIYYSLPVSYLDYDQFSKRIELYKDKRALTYYHLLARGTRDEVTYLAMRRQEDVAKLLLTKPKLAERILQRL